MTLSRRQFLRGSAVSLGALAGSRLLPSGTVSAQAPRAADRFAAPLPLPSVLTDADITLVAAEADVPILPGPPTRMWTFNGTFPGPLIRRPSGQTTRVMVEHRLPEEAGTLTIHHHGNHSASSEDGQPGRNVIARGESRTYTYEFVEDGAPERAALQWYHDHTHYFTGQHVWRGLAGMVILDDAFDAALPLPRGRYDVPLMIVDRTFDASNQLTNPFTAPQRADGTPVGAVTSGGTAYPPSDEVIGNHVLVNGAVTPHLEVEARRYRFRILNASNFLPYNLRLSDGSALVQIATESGLLPAPLARDAVLLGPAERAEVVVDFTGKTGQRIVLGSVNAPGSGLLPRTAAANRDVMEFRVVPAAGVDESAVPDALRPLPAWVAGASGEPDRIWVFGLGADAAGPAWTINGRTFEHDRMDARPELGSVETWLLVNATPVTKSHYIHIHDVDWYVLERNGEPPEPHEAALKETFRLDPGETLLVAAKFSDHLGPYMIHCHMLEHEDHGMMTNFEVVEPGAGDRKRQGVDSLLAGLPPTVAAHARRIVGQARAGRPAPMPTDGATPSGAASPYWCKTTLGEPS